MSKQLEAGRAGSIYCLQILDSSSLLMQILIVNLLQLDKLYTKCRRITNSTPPTV